MKFLAWTAGSLAVAALVFLGWWRGLLFPHHIHVESEPGGAAVFADGRLLGRTPARDLRVPGRTTDIVVELDGYYPYPLSLAESGPRVRLRLTPMFLRLNFDSRPSGAEVYVNGKRVGSTPLREVRVRNDLRNPSLLVKLDGYESWATTIDAKNLPPALITLVPGKAGQ